jgi:hypothetical protein
MAKDDKALAPVEQRSVSFYGDDLTAVRADDGRVYASVKNMCDALGLNSRGQSQRIDRHTVLSRGKGACKIHTPGGEQNVVVLRADLVPLWLAGVRTSMVSEDIRPKLEKFQEEAAAVLWEAFQTGELMVEEDFATLLDQDSPAVDAYKMALAMVKLAKNQVLLESRLGYHGERLDDLDRRLTNIEADLHDDERTITEAQATQISQAIRAIGLTMTKSSGENQYGKVWGEFYRKFGVSKYRNLSGKKFDEAMKFLSDWYEQLTDESLPF